LDENGFDELVERMAQSSEVHGVLERVVAQHSDRKNSLHYLCKWEGVPYAGCTWETGESLQCEADQACLSAFHRRSATQEKISSSTRHRRPAFKKMAAMPEYLEGGGTLRDYQLEGVNWMAYSHTELCRSTNTARSS